MSENERSDGPLIGILVVLVLLVMAAIGVLGLGYVRVNRAVMQERDAMEAARQEALQQRDAAEAARAAAEAAEARAAEVKDSLTNSEDAPPVGLPASSNSADTREPQP
jgi:Tfp pilus assembly protein PilV